MTDALPTLDPEAFRRQAHQVVDWMADYLGNVGMLPLQPSAEPGAVRAQLPGPPPPQGDSFERIIGDFERTIVHVLTPRHPPAHFA